MSTSDIEMPTPFDEIIVQRRNQYGDWNEVSKCTRELKDTLESFGVQSLLPSQREALEMICSKMARIVCGSSASPDSWDDIGGYALLGKRGHG